MENVSNALVPFTLVESQTDRNDIVSMVTEVINCTVWSVCQVGAIATVAKVTTPYQTHKHKNHHHHYNYRCRNDNVLTGWLENNDTFTIRRLYRASWLESWYQWKLKDVQYIISSTTSCYQITTMMLYSTSLLFIIITSIMQHNDCTKLPQ